MAGSEFPMYCFERLATLVIADAVNVAFVAFLPVLQRPLSTARIDLTKIGARLRGGENRNILSDDHTLRANEKIDRKPRTDSSCRQLLATTSKELDFQTFVATLAWIHQREKDCLLSDGNFHEKDRQPASPVDKLNTKQGRQTVVDFIRRKIAQINPVQIPFA